MHTCINWCLTLLQFVNVFEYVKLMLWAFFQNALTFMLCLFVLFILTDISGFELNTEQRSHKRENFEMHKKAREAEIEAAKRQRERQKEEEEKAYVAKVRAEAVHKSQPIKRFKSVEVLPSDRPLTFAESPKFETDRRLRSKVNCF